MNATREIPIISPDAGDRRALSDPNSPASIMKRAKEQESQSAADMKYDAQPPPRIEGYTQYVEVIWEKPYRKESIAGLFLASAVLLFMYAAAPDYSLN